jgi:transposase-like protein
MSSTRENFTAEFKESAVKLVTFHKTINIQ